MASLFCWRHVLQQQSGSDPERIGEPTQVVKCGVPFAALYPANVGPIHARLNGESFLAETTFLAQSAQFRAEGTAAHRGEHTLTIHGRCS